MAMAAAVPGGGAGAVGPNFAAPSVECRCSACLHVQLRLPSAEHPPPIGPVPPVLLDNSSLLGDNVDMDTPERDLRILILSNGRAPFKDWLRSLRDRQTKARILSRIDRLRLGNFGDYQSVGDGVFELRIHFGPGYRVYFGLHGAQVVLLLCGGDKSTQARDIADAQRYWKEFLTDEN